jgi:CDP-diacylglycerol--glycerol-3-phosphate 3-phosphatidyltransferase
LVIIFKANGFYNSKGVSKYIPQAYTFLEKQFYSDICHIGKEHLIKIQEYKRPGWTFHAKGVLLASLFFFDLFIN